MNTSQENKATKTMKMDISNGVTSKKKTVVLTAPYFPPHSGGLERYVYEIANHINKKEWNIEIITTSENDTDEIEEQVGCTIHRLKYDSKISNTPFSFRWFASVKNKLTEIQPDLINIHMPVPGLGDVVALVKPKNVPLVVTYHGDSMKKGRLIPDILVWLYEHGPLVFLLKKASHIICSSETVRRGFLERYMHKSSTILPAVNTEVFTPNSVYKEKDPTVLFVAGLGSGEEHKGLETLLYAFVKLKDTVPTTKLRIVGGGNKLEHYQKLTEKLHIAESVVFTGKLTGEALVREYQKAHVFALPTENESFGMVIAEAMACGLPTVSTHVGGVPLLVDDGKTGMLIVPKDKDALAEKLIWFTSNLPRAYAFGVAGRNKISRGFSWGSRARSFEAVYTKALTAKKTIAHIVGYYPPHTGGMEVVAQEVATELSKRKYDIRVFTSSLGAKSSPKLEKETDFILRRLRSVEFAHTPVMWSLPLRLLFLPKGTILHLHLAQALIPEIVLCIGKIRGFKMIAHFHLDVEPSGKLGWLFLLYKKYVLGFVLRRMDAVMVFSKEQEELVVSKHRVQRKKMHQIENAVSSIFFQERKETLPHDPLRILVVARLTVQKRVERMILAMPLLDFDAELVIVGDGEDREKLEELAVTKGITNVRFVGNKTHEEIKEYHAWADVFVIPSDKEGGMPLVALEAMAGGLPVVGSNLVGIRELVHGVGIVVDNPSPEAFSVALNALQSVPSKFGALSQRSSAFAKKHTWNVAVSLIEKVYTEVQIEK